MSARTTNRYDVAVVGGGLAGSSAAVAFARQGCTVRLFERRDLARDPNRGDMLHPPTVATLAQLGLLEPVDARGAVTMQAVETVGPEGTLLVQPDMGGCRVLNHAEMEAVFLEAAEAQGAVVTNGAVRSLTRDDEGNWAVATDDETITARFVVGADGAESLTRATLGIALDDVHEYEHRLVVLHANAPGWLAPACGWTLFHPDGAVFMFPTTPAGRVRIILTVEPDSVRAWMTSSDAELAARLGARHPQLQGLQLTKRGGSHVYRLRRSHAARYVGPHAAIVGDAAHTTHTMGGQGLNMAIQDAAKLAELVGPVLHDPTAGDAALAEVLAAFEAARRPINAATIDTAHRASAMCGPGQAAYELALDFYRRAAADPNFLREFNRRGRPDG